MIREHAHAKINLALDVVKKRKDGFHELQMIMVPIDLFDTLEFELADVITLESDVKIENNFKDSNLDSESVILEIWTNGTITPHEALYEISKNTVKMFNHILNNKIEDSTVFNRSEIKDIKKEKHKDISIEELQLSARSYNCLKHIQIFWGLVF